MISTANVLAKERIKITTGEWPPYFSTNLPDLGVGSLMVKEAYKLVNIEVDLLFFPWARSLETTQRGKYEGSALWRKNKEREKSFHYSDPVLPYSTHFFHLKKMAFDWQTLADLSGYKVGTTLKYSYADEFDQAIKNRLIDNYVNTSDELNMKLLLKERIEIFPMDISVGLHILGQHFTPEEAKQITYHPNPLTTESLYLIFPKSKENSAYWLKKFNEGMSKLYDSEYYHKLLKRLTSLKVKTN